MSSNALRLRDDLQLPDQERAELALRLLDSVGEPADQVERAWIDEAKRRLAEIERGEVRAVPCPKRVNASSLGDARWLFRSRSIRVRKAEARAALTLVPQAQQRLSSAKSNLRSQISDTPTSTRSLIASCADFCLIAFSTPSSTRST